MRRDRIALHLGAGARPCTGRARGDRHAVKNGAGASARASASTRTEDSGILIIQERAERLKGTDRGAAHLLPKLPLSEGAGLLFGQAARAARGGGCSQRCGRRGNGLGGLGGQARRATRSRHRWIGSFQSGRRGNTAVRYRISCCFSTAGKRAAGAFQIFSQLEGCPPPWEGRLPLQFQFFFVVEGAAGPPFRPFSSRKKI